MAEATTGGRRHGNVRPAIEGSTSSQLCALLACADAPRAVRRLSPSVAVAWATREPDVSLSPLIAHRSFFGQGGTLLTLNEGLWAPLI